jgi:hypothetical protein
MPNHFQKLLLLVLVAFIFQGNVQAQTSQQKSIMACNGRIGNVELQWVKIQNVKSLKLPAKNGTAKLPLKYTVFTVNGPALKKYMMSLKAKPGNIVLPVGGDPFCIEAYVANSGTMSAGLAAKFPQLVSLKGNGVKDKSATVRLDYDGAALNAEIISAGVSYIIEPWKKGSTIYYLLFKKEDSGVERKPLTER